MNTENSFAAILKPIIIGFSLNRQPKMSSRKIVPLAAKNLQRKE